MELIGKIADLNLDFITGKPKLTLQIESISTSELDELKSCEKLSIKIGKYREKRSLNANALCWKLCTEIANVVRSDKDSIYVMMLERYGQSDIVSVLDTVDVSGYFKYYKEFGTGFVKGKKFIHYKVFKGSSEYDSLEMSILLDGICEEAKAMNIPVLSASELALIKSNWNDI